MKTVSLRHVVVSLFLVLALAACGGESDTESTPTPKTDGTTTAAAGEMTVRDVVSLSDDAWPSVQFMRTTSRSGAVPGQDGEPEPFNGSVQEWTPNGNRHIIEFRDDHAVNEQIYADGVVYMRGEFVSAAVAPEVGTDTWVILDTTVVPQDTPVGIQIRYLTREQHNPYGELSDDLLDRPVHESGTVSVGNRSCTLFTFGDESKTGTEIRYELAVDEYGLPCQLVQRAGDFQNSTVYEFNVDGAGVVAPTENATPVSGTPEG